MRPAPPPRRVDVLLIDLDDTLYQGHEMPQLVAELIRKRMVDLGLCPQAEVEETCRSLYLNYGTTLAGLVASGHDIDTAAWHTAVHAPLPYGRLLRRDPALRALLDSIPVRKFVFTNADAAHAATCLRLLGLDGCFDGVVAFESVQAAAAEAGLAHGGRPVVCKPAAAAMELALAAAGGVPPERAVFFDDSARNVASAHRHGVYSVLVGRPGVECACDAAIGSMHDLPAAMPWLWGAAGPPASAPEARVRPAPAAVPLPLPLAADVALAAGAEHGTVEDDDAVGNEVAQTVAA